MKRFYFLILFPMIMFAQVFTIDNDYIELFSNSIVGEFSKNTFLNTLEETTITYKNNRREIVYIIND